MVWEEERVTGWTYAGLIFMGLCVIGMVSCVAWMFTW